MTESGFMICTSGVDPERSSRWPMAEPRRRHRSRPIRHRPAISILGSACGKDAGGALNCDWTAGGYGLMLGRQLSGQQRRPPVLALRDVAQRLHLQADKTLEYGARI
ncbi:hypothetical protein ACIBH1_46780 [Nonomuraea sp. NPDC050663]|uniref:hypothetical protein n=1 Tax=Nonomuraea sp. NPDC050663 TaxID=3364370 RepID=UPI0037BD1160